MDNLVSNPNTSAAAVTSVNDISDEMMFIRIACPEELNKSVKEKQRWPRPKFMVTGRRFLVIQDDETKRIGSIYIPDNYQKKYQVTSGVVLQVGEGYDPDSGGGWEPPYAVGDRVAWGRYNDTEVEIDVEPEWWSEEEKARPLKKVKFVILEWEQIKGILF